MRKNSRGTTSLAPGTRQQPPSLPDIISLPESTHCRLSLLKAVLAEEKEYRPFSLSDVIPPLAIVKSLSATSLAYEETAVLKSLFMKAVENPFSRVRVHSDSRSKRITRANARTSDVPGPLQALFSVDLRGL